MMKTHVLALAYFCIPAVVAKLQGTTLLLAYAVQPGSPGSLLAENGVDAVEGHDFDNAVITYVAPHLKDKRDENKDDPTVMPIVNGDVHVGDSMESYIHKIKDYAKIEANKEEKTDFAGNRFKRKPGDLVQCPDNVMYSGQYRQNICKWAKNVWHLFNPNHVRVWLNQKFYAVSIAGGKFFAQNADFDADIGHLAQLVKDSSETCEGRFHESNEFYISIAIRAKKGEPCTTPTEASAIKDALEACIRDAEGRSAVGYCCRMDDSVSWGADVRVHRKDISVEHIWNMPCAY